MLVPANMIACGFGILISPWVPWALALPVTYVSALSGASVVLGFRHRSVYCALWAGPVAFVMHTAWASGFLLGLRNPEARWSPSMTRPLWGANREWEPAA